MMERKPNTINKITAKFTDKTLSLIKVEPDYEVINKIIKLLYANKTTLTTPQGGGHHSQIGIIMKLTLYTTLTVTAWTSLPNLGV